jgi:hypothetical protein
MRRYATVLAAAVVLPLSACGDDDPTEPAVEVSGSYTLETINGNELPVTVERAGTDSLEVMEGSVTFNDANGTFADSILYRLTLDGEVTLEDDVLTGTYTQTGTSLTLSTSGGGQYSMTLSDDLLSQTFASFSFVYRKCDDCDE